MPSLLRLASSDMVLLITREARIGDFSGILIMVYPYVLLEPILPLLSAQTLYSVGTRAPSEEIKERTRRVLQGVALPVQVELGRADCTVRELLELERNDILVLSTKTTDNLEVRVGGVVKFRATPGLQGKQRAAQISEVVENEDTLPQALL